MRLSISGIVTPDCAVADTGEPAGEQNGAPYWQWIAGGQTWYLWKWANLDLWIINKYLGSFIAPYWTRDAADHLGDYSPTAGTTGIATVEEYVPVASVVTNILLGSTVDTCRILDSRIVRGLI